MRIKPFVCFRVTSLILAAPLGGYQRLLVVATVFVLSGLAGSTTVRGDACCSDLNGTTFQVDRTEVAPGDIIHVTIHWLGNPDAYGNCKGVGARLLRVDEVGCTEADEQDVLHERHLPMVGYSSSCGAEEVVLTLQVPEVLDPGQDFLWVKAGLAYPCPWDWYTNGPCCDIVQLTVVVGDPPGPVPITDPVCIEDCDGNGIPDFQDICDDSTLDCNFNGVLDECESWQGGIIFVDADATGGLNNGESWVNAYIDLQDAFLEARGVPGAEIWVAAGTYTPTPDPVLREATFRLGCFAIYGGFPNGGGPWEARDPQVNETILSGDLYVDDAPVACTQNSPDCDSYGGLCASGYCILPANNGENSYHVVTGGDTDQLTILDGFTISGGNADSSTFQNSWGGGMFNYTLGSPTLTNCTFSGNSASSGGGGMYNHLSSSPTLTNCTFSGNSTGYYGGGMYNYLSSNPTLTNSTFSINSAYQGGGMYNRSNSSPTLTNCIFSGNSTGYYGGGMYNYYLSSPTLTSCTFSGNSTGWSGGGMYNEISSSPMLTNCTFSGNSANNSSSYGGGMYNRSTSSPTLINCTFSGNSANSRGGGMDNVSNCSPTVTNCILWGNTAPTGYGPQAYLDATSTMDVEYCDVEDGEDGIEGPGTLNWGVGNIDLDPLLVDPLPGTEDDNLRLSAGSPCIDDGNNAAVPPGITTDLDGNPRFVDDPATPDCPQPGADCGTPPIVDMGAYEFQPQGCSTCLGDANGDGNINGLDIQCFTNCVLGSPGACTCACADIDGDGQVTTYDTSLFIDLLLNFTGACVSFMATDCNGNGIPDYIEYTLETDPPNTDDCNGNYLLDVCDIADGTSQDCNGNSVPDECDITGGSSLDCQPNGIPDGCEGGPWYFGDVDGNGDVNLNDLSCQLDGMRGLFTCQDVTFDDMEIFPCVGGDGDINLMDVLAILDALAGQPPCPDPCP